MAMIRLGPNPTPAGTSERADGLAPVRAYLLAAAQRDATELVAQAEATASAMLAEAAAEADGIRAEARARGQADGAGLAASAQARARRQARELLLSAQRDCLDQLREQSRQQVLVLRSAPDYPRIRARLRELAISVAGAGAAVHEHPSGGVVAESASRRVDCSLAALADRALDALGPELVDLWTP